MSVLTPFCVSQATVFALPTAKLTSPGAPLFPVTVMATAAATPERLNTAQIAINAIGLRLESWLRALGAIFWSSKLSKK